MKTLKHLFLTTAFMSILGFVNAQNDDNAKARFIKEQNYLSKSSLKDYKNYYGDSLNGFDEKTLRAALISERALPEEIIYLINKEKREFINRKYGMGKYDIKKAPPLQILDHPPVHSNPIYSNPMGNSNSGGVNSKTIGGGSSVNVFPCVNEDFEATAPGTYQGSTNAYAVTGWTIESTGTQNSPGCNLVGQSWALGSAEFEIVSTPLANPFSSNGGNQGHVPTLNACLPILPNSPLGGSRVAHLNNANSSFLATKLSSQFPVTAANVVFQFAFAGSWDGTAHNCCERPALHLALLTCNDSIIGCSTLTLTAGGGCSSGAVGTSTCTNGMDYCSWIVKYIDLTPYIGTCIKVVAMTSDCYAGGHHGNMFFDARCGGSIVCPSCPSPTNAVTQIPGLGGFCAGGNQAVLAAPQGYATYSWVAPPPPAAQIQVTQTAMQTPTLISPTLGDTYTVYMTSPSGCPFMSIVTLTYTQVGITGIGSSPSCPGGANGTATVIGYGSGAGYTYTWTNSSNVVVGTSSVATGLATGLYSVTIAGAGSAGCGTAVATVSVGTAPSALQIQIMPFCNGQAYLSAPLPGGTNHQWYNGTAAISWSLGGNASSYTVTNAVANQSINLGYDVQGCHDTIQFILQNATPGSLALPVLGPVCPGFNNGTATITMYPAPNAPVTGLNTYSVFSTSNPPSPQYTSFSGNTNGQQYFPSGMAAGSYSVIAFDGLCKYTTTFVLLPQVYNFTISSVTGASLCSGGSKQFGVQYQIGANPAAYSYSWSPSTFAPANTNSANLILAPTIPQGTSVSVIYTLTMSSLDGGCQVTDTAMIFVFNPMTPTLSGIPALCNTNSPYQIVSNPPNSTYVSSLPTMVSSSGLITPANIGNNYGIVTYTATQTSYTCLAKSVATFEVSKFNTAALTSSVPPLCVTNSPFNLSNIVQSTATGIWNGTSVQSSGGSYFFDPSTLATGNYVLTYSTFSTPNPNACPDMSNIGVAVTKTTVPAITPVAPFCTNKNAFNLTASPSGGTWVGTGVSATGVVTPGPALVPNTVVSYSVNDGPCVNSNTVELSVSQFFSAALSGHVPDLCYNSNPYSLMSIVQNTVSGVWSGINVSSDMFSTSGLPTNTYVLQYKTSSSPNATLCADESTVAVSVSNPSVPSIVQPPTMCNNASTLQLTATPNIGYWETTSYVTTAGVFNPAASAIGNNAVQYVIGTSTCNTTNTINITIEAFVSAATTSANLGDKCNTGAIVNLVPMEYNSGAWSGLGITGSSFDPAAVGVGSFTLTHSTSSSPSGLCPDQATMAVNVFSLAPPVVSKIGPFCSVNAPVTLPVEPIGGVFGGINTGAVSPAGLFNPASALIGENIVNYSVTSGPCVAYTQATISVEKFVSADIINPKVTFCKNDAAINLNSMVLNPGGQWDGNGVVGSMFTPANAIEGNQNIITYKTHSMPTASLCPDEKEIRIMVRPKPMIEVESDINKGCSPLRIVLSVKSTTVNTGTLTWNFGNGSPSQTGLNVENIYSTPGKYNVTYNYEDNYGCKADPGMLNASISVFESPRPEFAVPSEISMSNPEVVFVNQTSDLSSNLYKWTVPGLYESGVINAKIAFPAPGKYPVTLLASAAGVPDGCSNAITKTIDVKSDFFIFIPNSFTPNGDKLNDVFAPVFPPYITSLSGYDMEIFDRWGHLLFQSKDINKGWDGTINGEEAKEEVYIYRIKFKDESGKLQTKTSHVTLVR